MRVGRPDSAAPTATRNATVTCSGSSSPVVKLMTAFPAICAPLADVSERTVQMAMAGRRPGFPLRIQWREAVEQPVLHGEQGGRRTGGGTDLGVDALDVGLGRLGSDSEPLGDLTGGGAAGDEGEHLHLARREARRDDATLAWA